MGSHRAPKVMSTSRSGEAPHARSAGLRRARKATLGSDARVAQEEFGSRHGAPSLPEHHRRQGESTGRQLNAVHNVLRRLERYGLVDRTPARRRWWAEPTARRADAPPALLGFGQLARTTKMRALVMDGAWPDAPYGDVMDGPLRGPLWGCRP